MDKVLEIVKSTRLDRILNVKPSQVWVDKPKTLEWLFEYSCQILEYQKESPILEPTKLKRIMYARAKEFVEEALSNYEEVHKGVGLNLPHYSEIGNEVRYDYNPSERPISKEESEKYWDSTNKFKDPSDMDDYSGDEGFGDGGP